jgi:hypothetical protein
VKSQAEVQQLRLPVRRDENVRRFEIAVDQPMAVCFGQGFRNLPNIAKYRLREPRDAY